MNSDLYFETYQSPFSWRYGSGEMRQIFSEVNRRKTWRKVWVALAKAQHKLGLVSSQELADIEKHKNDIDITKSHKIEKEIKHDLMAELKTYALQAKVGGGKLHLGATSQDIEDNADAINLSRAVLIIESNLKNLLLSFEKQIVKNKDLVCMAYTHLQPAQPTTLGYRLSFYAQDLLIDWQLLQFVKNQIKGKGIKGAVGNAASYVFLAGQKAQNLEKEVLEDLGIEAFDVTTQVYPRKIDYLIIVLLSSIAQSLYKFALDLRIMQSPGFGEMAESFSSKQVGSSAMPFKRNPQSSERICSLSRYIVSLSKVAWDNAANSILERTLDDSASRRIILPDAFLATDEILMLAIDVVKNLSVDRENIQKNLEKYGPFSALEKIMIEATRNGADRQEVHEILRKHAMRAYSARGSSVQSTIALSLKSDPYLKKYLSNEKMASLVDYKKHTGLASQKSLETARKIRNIF